MNYSEQQEKQLLIFSAPNFEGWRIGGQWWQHQRRKRWIVALNLINCNICSGALNPAEFTVSAGGKKGKNWEEACECLLWWGVCCLSSHNSVFSDQFWLSCPGSLHGHGRHRASLSVPLRADGGRDLWVVVGGLLRQNYQNKESEVKQATGSFF